MSGVGILQDVPVNALHSCGYVSIGCEPCTRPVLPNQHEREGRWWWEVSIARTAALPRLTQSGTLVLQILELHHKQYGVVWCKYIHPLGSITVTVPYGLKPGFGSVT